MDTELIRAIKNGNRAAYNEFVALHWARLLAYARKIVGDYAEDVLQDVFVNVWLKKDRLREDIKPDAYLIKSVYNACVDRLRSKNVNGGGILDEEKLLANNPDSIITDDQLKTMDIKGQLSSALKLLPPRCRQVFHLSYIEGYTAAEISSMLGISVSTVNNQIYKSLQILRKELATA